jgi:ribA/ribD-fused uncharacterized protein
MEPILFWAAHKINEDGTKVYDENFFMSNFYRQPFTAEFFGEAITFRTSENYYQARKFADKEKFLEIANAKTPREAADLGRTFSGMDPDWDNKRDDVMYDALKLKFSDPKLRQKLLDTGDAELVEASPKDAYWGKFNGVGKNMLGILLMKVRDELKC